MAYRWKPYWRSIVGMITFGGAFIAGILTVGVPYIGPLAFLVTILVCWEAGLIAGLVWIGTIHVIIPAILTMNGLGPLYLFPQAKSAVITMMFSALVAEVIIAFLTVHLRRLNEQLARSKSELQTMNTELQATLAEVKELQGLLPICAWCKKIRDDAGTWEVTAQRFFTLLRWAA